MQSCTRLINLRIHGDNAAVYTHNAWYIFLKDPKTAYSDYKRNEFGKYLYKESISFDGLSKILDGHCSVY